MNRKTLEIIAASVLGTLTVLALVSLLVIYSGEYNVAATKPHYRPVAWALQTAMENSVRDHAEGIEVPPLGDSAQVRAGFASFDAMCVTCHGAPGQERSAIGKGVLPEPPPLSEQVPHWTPAQLYWIVKHGIKMSAMPAFGPTHSDEQIWKIVAFLQRLPELSPEQYQAMKQAAQQGGDGHSHGGGGGGHGGGSGHSH